MKKNIILLVLILFLAGIYANAQYINNEENGIHVSGGYSEQGLNSSNIGEDCEATGTRSFAGGLKSIATGSCGFAFGNKCEANQTNSYVLGNNAKAFGANNLALGFYIENRQNGAIIIGSGENVNSPLITTVPGITMGMGSSQPTLFISKALGYGTGKVGIGNVFSPEAKLHIRSDQYEDAGIILEPIDLENSNTFIRLRDENHEIVVNNNGVMTISSMNASDLGSLVLQGHVGINTTNESDTYALAVNGGILTNEVFIKNVDEWYDNVFAKDYKLLSLFDLKRYIKEFGHLPEVPSETEVLTDGYNMAEMQSILLKKIEELTLYTIQQQEEIEMLKRTIEELKGK